MGPLRALGAALGLFSIIPAPTLTTLDRRVATSAMRAFPVLGLLLGATAGALSWGIVALGGGQPLAAVLGIGVLVLATGAMHLDGIADTADGLASTVKARDALEIMKKSDIGPMGVAALLFAVLLEIAALLSPQLYGWRWLIALAGMAGIGRLAAMAATGTWVPCARPGGFGSYFAGITTPVALGIESLVLLGLLAVAGYGVDSWAGAMAASAAGIIALGAGMLWRRRIVARLGGITGDVIGSVIELTQVVFLIAFVVALALV
ncbi:MAG: adenosylcobinamide-GDP ribazoletransferase [Propionibacteriaceae bacterium]